MAVFHWVSACSIITGILSIFAEKRRLWLGKKPKFCNLFKNCSFWPVFGNQSTKCTVSALHRGNDNLLRAEFISGKNLLESLPKENFSSQPVVDLWFRQNYGLAQFSIRSETLGF